MPTQFPLKQEVVATTWKPEATNCLHRSKKRTGHTHGKSERVRVKPFRCVKKPKESRRKRRVSLKERGGKPAEAPNENWSAAAALHSAASVTADVYSAKRRKVGANSSLIRPTFCHSPLLANSHRLESPFCGLSPLSPLLCLLAASPALLPSLHRCRGGADPCFVSPRP